MRLLETDTSSNTNIASATSVASYTADAAREVIARVLVDQAAGAGDYIVYAKCQRGGSGSSYVMLPKTTGTAASGETAIGFVSISLPVSTGDVVTIWVDGLAGDTTTPDVTTDWYEVDALRPATADRTLTVDASGRVDVSKVEGSDATDQIRDAILSDATRFAGSDVATIKGYVDTVETVLAAVQTALTTIQGYTDTLEAGQTTIQGYVDGVESTLATLTATLATVAGYTDTLEAAVAALPSAASINTVLTAAHGAGSWGAADGGGPVNHTVTITDGADPVDNARVYLTSDSAGVDTLSVVAGTFLTNASGVYTFLGLDASTAYWLHAEKAGLNFTPVRFTTDAA